MEQFKTGRFAVAELAAWAVRRRRRFCVGGRSMLPTLEPGSFVLVDPRRIPEIGLVVVAGHPTDETMVLVKRIQSIDHRGVFLSSDNVAEGSDSSTIGLVSIAEVRGVVTLSLDTLSAVL